ncbi:trifunctional dihydropteroate synthetase/dihydrohydroxymethylpterin pyrophosphokinase/dihydroneopterin aldolase FOL1 [Ascoidea rubescens DSM 1968]|uniref:Dihydropteroate synthase n=1 Tax=Ascoidea rubescens DSM 1968 TaxID=1344418 RepID=A0A1D2VH47_9ASCO|nr:Dihydropteroate synthase [Ascoidea rubescens DSM 1968]ODV60991.1 Dihydropteroate synthase [Ascoidea rubescens DSM 1968]
MNTSADKIFVNNLSFNANIENDSWNKKANLPFKLSLQISTNINESGKNDDLSKSIDYAIISNNILNYFNQNSESSFIDEFDLLSKLSSNVIHQKNSNLNSNSCSSIEFKLTSFHSLIRPHNLQIVLNKPMVPTTSLLNNNTVIINGLKLLTLIGYYDFERIQKQYVSLDFSLDLNQFLFQRNLSQKSSKEYSLSIILNKIINYVENDSFFITIEALIYSISLILLNTFNLDCKINLSKLNAICHSDSVGIEIKRSLPSNSIKNFNTIQNAQHTTPSNIIATNINNLKINDTNKTNNFLDHTVYISFGSNQGNQVQNILIALQHLQSQAQIISLSSLYKTNPMYYLDQPSFINGAVKIKTKLSPLHLLHFLKKIEYDILQRVKYFDNGPRSIDLDILLYDELVFDNHNEITHENKSLDHLILPHPRMLERLFVLKPLLEIADPTFLHPVTKKSIHSHLNTLRSSTLNKQFSENEDLINIIPFPRYDHKKFLSFNFNTNENKTLIMGIINTTPDSFSDAGLNLQLEKSFKNVENMVYSGVDIIDIGGCSTRPGSKFVAPDEELNRVLPLIEAIRLSKDEKVRNVLISIDTFRAEVALKSVQAGADIINDISMGQFDDQMFNVVKETGVPYIIGHTKGKPDEMSKLDTYTKNSDPMIIEHPSSEHQSNLIEEEKILSDAICKELSLALLKAYKVGVKKWQIILDPGIGFAKNLKQNLSIMRAIPSIKNYSLTLKNKENLDGNEFISFKNLPILLGTSRKRFIGTITNEDISNGRLLGTAATVMACIGFQSDIIRVHDVESIKTICLMGDAIYKNIL